MGGVMYFRNIGVVRYWEGFIFFEIVGFICKVIFFFLKNI